jgi:hypothetical protein
MTKGKNKGMTNGRKRKEYRQIFMAIAGCLWFLTTPAFVIPTQEGFKAVLSAAEKKKGIPLFDIGYFFD